MSWELGCNQEQDIRKLVECMRPCVSECAYGCVCCCVGVCACMRGCVSTETGPRLGGEKYWFSTKITSMISKLEFPTLDKFGSFFL